jgi:hypothetical protein
MGIESGGSNGSCGTHEGGVKGMLGVILRVRQLCAKLCGGCRYLPIVSLNWRCRERAKGESKLEL